MRNIFITEYFPQVSDPTGTTGGSAAPAAGYLPVEMPIALVLAVAA
jgi:hypothetical protein